MPKYCIKKYPKGTIKGQQSDGRYIDGWLYKNLELLADKIVKDMTFLGIIYSSTLEVGTGKSVLATQIGEAWTEIINKKHNLNIEYGINNIVWRPKDLIDRAFKVPKYSYILLDEWEDSTYWSQLGMSLRQFFRKCRQLNLFIMCIIPNWFQLPMSYAVSRSIFAIDVKFNNTLDRGFFSFYNFPAKRALYIIGKRTHNYFAAKPTFSGRFTDGYGVDEREYRKKKMEDMLRSEEEEESKKTKSQIESETKIIIVKQLLDFFKEIPQKEFAKALNVSPKTITRWKTRDVEVETPPKDNYNNKHTIKIEPHEVVVNEEELLKDEKEKQFDEVNNSEATINESE